MESPKQINIPRSFGFADNVDSDDDDCSWLMDSTNIVVKPRSAAETAKRLSWGQHNINAGCLRELPMIAIDKFHGEALQANTFFLTHMHTDHMAGLEFLPFLKRLRDPEVKLYASTTTLPLFRIYRDSGYFGTPEDMQRLIKTHKIIPVPVNNRIELDYSSKNGKIHKKIYVTLIPAGHCPGSVMLLFEYDSERILYTGDFRLNDNEIKNLSSCYYQSAEEYARDYPTNSASSSSSSTSCDFKSKLKKISHLYLDTTFCTSKGLTSHGSMSSVASSTLVSRDKAIERVLPIFAKHLEQTNSIIQIEFSGNVSHEYAIIQFFKILKLKTHVSDEIYKTYAEIDSCVSAMTTEPTANIHFCKSKEGCMKGKKVLRVKFSAMWYTSRKGKSSSSPVRETGNFVKVCYSMHASMHEMGTMISVFDAQVVTPLVQPRDVPREQIEMVLRSVTNHKFQYKDYENEPINMEADEAIDSTTTSPANSQTEPVSSISPLKSPPEEEFESVVQVKRKKMITWTREQTPPPIKY